jgi:hypothetical protein
LKNDRSLTGQARCGQDELGGVKKQERKMGHIQVMFNPATIALIGATEKTGAVGRTILENLLRSKERKIFPVWRMKMNSIFLKNGIPGRTLIAT